MSGISDTMTPDRKGQVVYYFDEDGKPQAVDADHPLPTSSAGGGGEVALAASDAEIGAVELKDGAGANRATIDGTGQLSVKDAAVLAAVDGLEALVTATNAALASVDGHVDGVEALLTLHSGYLDGLEAKLDAINTTLGSGTSLEAPTFIGASSTNIGVQGDPTVIDVPTDNAQAGDILIIWGSIRIQDANLPAGFTALQAPAGTADTTFADFFIYYKFLNGTEPNTLALDLTGDAANGEVGAIVYRGVDNTTPFNVNSGEQVAVAAMPATPDPVSTTDGDSVALVIGAANSGSNVNVWNYGAVAPLIERLDANDGARCSVFAYEAPVVPGANNLPNVTPTGTVGTTFGLITLVLNPGVAPEASDAGTATTNTDVVVDATAGGVVILAANAHRKGFIIQNTGADNVRVSIGSNPTATHGIQLRAGESLSMAAPKCPTGLIKAIREGAVSSACAAIEVV